jgi:membrane fusion protein (multidrug efflux system)
MPDSTTVERASEAATPPGDATAAASAQQAPAESGHAVATTARRPRRRVWLWIVLGAVVVLGAIAATPAILRAFNTVSTDDAYVNGHFTFVAPRVAGQVTRVLVDDNNRVHKGDLIVQLDKEPYLVQLRIAQAAVDAAQADLVLAEAQTRGVEAQMRSARFNLDHAIEDVDNQIALLSAKVATLNSMKASQAKAQADYDRALPLEKSGAVSSEELDHRKQALLVAQAQMEEALQGVYQVRVALGQPPKPPSGDDLTQVPPGRCRPIWIRHFQPCARRSMRSCRPLRRSG